MCIRYFCIHYKPPFKTVKLVEQNVITFHENAELVPPGDSYDIHIGNYDPTEGITIFLVGI